MHFIRCLIDLKKQKHIDVLGIALLMLYAFSIAPSLVFHHHHEEVVAFSEADSCEKAIYYGIQDHHSAHISNTQDKCWLCDHYTIVPQILEDTEFRLLSLQFNVEFPIFYKCFHSIKLTGSSNKDPPVFA